MLALGDTCTERNLDAFEAGKSEEYLSFYLSLIEGLLMKLLYLICIIYILKLFLIQCYLLSYKFL